ncbi:hypothetical protein BLNAU_7125 [Blattamonas nauphoetae]|uniref:Uncharacterized protein n=1 Tax=Blattamonas nauphoetae TaxID=2049346 RepID=A0ABQ9Y2L4_9EUKA|nr:hypothetical protein BLNAU_7125 [Blattamonas nauphoetae]
MAEIVKKTDTASSVTPSDVSASQLLFSTACFPFLNWNDGIFRSEHEKVVIFRSLVATVKFQPTLDDSLLAKAVKLLESVSLGDKESTVIFLDSFGRTSDESLTIFIQLIGVLISSASQVITTAAMGMLNSLFVWSTPKVRLALVKADLIPQLIITLNPLSLSVAEAVDIHIGLIQTISNTVIPASEK